MKFKVFCVYVLIAIPFVISQVFADNPETFGLLDSVRYAIQNQPVLGIQQQQVESAKGALQREAGPFDYEMSLSAGHLSDKQPLTGIARAIVEASKVESNITNYDFSVSRQLRSGIVVNPTMRMLRTDDNLFNNTIPNQAAVGILVQLPLMKGSGSSSVGANEHAAELSYNATLLEQRHEISRTVLNTTIAYWNYVAAARDLKITRESEARAQKMLDQIKILIEAQEIPAAEINQVVANLASKTALVAVSEQTLIEARQLLGLEMGMPSEEIFSLPLPSDEFPSAVNAQVELTVSNLIEPALQRRSDLFALRKREESAQTLRVAAVKDLRPRLDLDFNFGYAGLNEGGGFNRLFSPFKDNVAGLNTSAGLRYSWPIGNSFAEGTLIERRAQQKQITIQTEDLIRRIASGVRVAAAAVENSTREVMKSAEAAVASVSALENEVQKLQIGVSTLIDIISMEERLTNTERLRIQALRRRATAIIRLRYETGSLIPPDSSEVSIDINQLTTTTF